MSWMTGTELMEKIIAATKSGVREAWDRYNIYAELIPEWEERACDGLDSLVGTDPAFDAVLGHLHRDWWGRPDDEDYDGPARFEGDPPRLPFRSSGADATDYVHWRCPECAKTYVDLASRVDADRETLCEHTGGVKHQMVLEPMSPALVLLQVVWDHCNRGRNKSWQTLNSSMSKALYLAIRANLRFDKEDFRVLASSFRWGYWCGGNGESFYTAACGETPNLSAVQAFEHAKGRPAFILHGKRLACGHMLTWGDGEDGWLTGTPATVTSIEGDSLIACTYQQGPTTEQTAAKALWRVAYADLSALGRDELEPLLQRSTFDGKVKAPALLEALGEMQVNAYFYREGTSKIKRRFTITRKELKAAERAAKDAGQEIWRRR